MTSIVGRFLEHSRIYYFRNGGDEEIYLGSADLMPRNLNRRVEVLFPVENPALVRHIRDDILAVYLLTTSRPDACSPTAPMPAGPVPRARRWSTARLGC